MSVPLILTNFTSGEISPSLFGRTDLAKYRNGASTARNAFVSYKGGLYSRAGTAYVGFSKQTGRDYPPRLITFQFSVKQGLALEFGNFYMRVILDGGYVTDNVVSITNITNSNPAVVTAIATGGSFASPDNTFTYSSYDTGDSITLDGGTFTIPATLIVNSTSLLSASISKKGTSGVYSPGDTITLNGGTQISSPILTVTNTCVVSATISSAGSGGTNGSSLVTGTTGTGTFFKANVTITGGAISSVDSISIQGNYTTNPTNPASEPVLGGGLVGATLNLQIGVLDTFISNAGGFTSNPSNGILTQSSTSGSGVGAEFNFGLFGPLSVSFSNPGVYTSFPPNPVQQGSTSGSGEGSQFIVSSSGVSPFVDGDWVYISGVGGMTELNGQTYVVGSSTPTSFDLFDIYGNPIDSTLFSSYIDGGSAARIYTCISPYSEKDLSYIKFTQSANVMTLCCVNQETNSEYPPYDLQRNSNTDWKFSKAVNQPTVSPPTSISASASPPPSGATSQTFYQYCVTSVDPVNGTESVASPIATISNAVDIAITTGSTKTVWSPVNNVHQYNVYKATPGYTYKPPVGALFGFVGSSYGTEFIDSNIVADFSQVPPKHSDPFARGQILNINVKSPGNGYSFANASIISSTGTGAKITCVIQEGQIVAYLVDDPGQDYISTDTVIITGNGSGAQGIVIVGPQTGTYPAVVSYFQQRRVYANTLRSPDTYYMSQPGSFKNFDRRLPTISSDAIIGTPWSVQVNGIQWLINMPGGLVVFTGLSAWQLTGSGGSSLNPQPITPSSQQAQPQAYNGSSPTIPPIKIDYDIIYVQQKGSIYRDISYNFYTNIYTGTDLTTSSSHLFTNFEIVQHAWCEEPYKILWSIRSDGNLLSLTYLKPQEVFGWSRHDTNGLFKTLCSVVEPPIDALYLGVLRNFPKGPTYVIERMDNRNWENVEDCWCVDCGFQLEQPAPNSNLYCSNPYGLGAISGYSDLIGGIGYSQTGTNAVVIDDNGNGTGSGAIVSLVIQNGSIADIVIVNPGSKYTYPSLVITDSTNSGTGAYAKLTLDNSSHFISSSPIFSTSDIGSVIRMGGGIANIKNIVTNMEVIADIVEPITSIQPNSVNSTNPDGLVQMQASGAWTMTNPVSKLTNLQPLAGMIVTGLADGNVISERLVNLDGTLDLDVPASSIIIGLPFQVQIQTPYIDMGEPTVQGQRKKISAATVRIEASLDVKVGCNQIDGSTLSPQQIAPKWENMQFVLNKSKSYYNSSIRPLYTGDERVPLLGGYSIHGQVCMQQDNPLPMQILCVIPEIWSGDIPQQMFQRRQEQKK